MLRRLLKGLDARVSPFGISLHRIALSIKGLRPFRSDFALLKKQGQLSDLDWPFGRKQPCLSDRYAHGGAAKGHYFHQDLLVARRIFENGPVRHVDVGSRVDGFVAHVAAFRPIEVIDIRPIESRVSNITFRQGDITAELPAELRRCCDSLSCLSVLEHFGLGRYGDPICYDGYIVGLRNLTEMLESGGILYLSVPMGPQRIEFNAHRVFSLKHLHELFDPAFAVERFSYVDDGGDLVENANLTTENIATNFGCHFGFAIFELRKL